MTQRSTSCPGVECCDEDPFYLIPMPASLTIGDTCSTCQGSTFSTTITAYGIGPLLTWTMTDGALPTGLTFHGGTNSNGFVTIDGTPSGSGLYSFTVKAENNEGKSISATFTIRVINITTTSPLPTFTVGSPYSTTLAVTGGVGPYTWFIVSGSLPSGLSLNASTGKISGTPDGGSAGSGDITFGVIDNGCS